MVTADEIRQRVEAADRARQQSRADAAASIASAVEQRTKVRAELAELDTSIAAQISASAAVLTLEELAEFTGIPVSELRTTARTTRSRKPGRSNPRGRTPRAGGRTRPAESATSSTETTGDAGTGI